jgi:DGQHR domain-containing protein
MSLTLPAFRFQQAGLTFYETFITGRMLTTPGNVEIDKWTPANPDGYQREPSQKRINKVASFLRGDLGFPGILPQSVLLGLRGQGKFKPAIGQPTNHGGAEVGTLHIQKEFLPLWEDDGQHRIGGLRTAAERDPKFLDYMLPAIIMEDSSPLREATLFYVINTTSVKVPVDLAQRLIAQQDQDPGLHNLLVQSGKDWIARATEICDLLNGTPNQPWDDFIRVPNTGSEQGVKQNTIVRSLRPLLTGEHVYKSQPVDTLAQLLIRYWKAIEKLWPDEIHEDTRDDYVLMKSTGVLTMHELAPVVFEAARAASGKVTEAALIKVLEPAKAALPANFWNGRHGMAGTVGTNNKAIRYVVAEIVKHVHGSELVASLL